MSNLQQILFQIRDLKNNGLNCIQSNIYDESILRQITDIIGSNQYRFFLQREDVNLYKDLCNIYNELQRIKRNNEIDNYNVSAQLNELKEVIMYKHIINDEFFARVKKILDKSKQIYGTSKSNELGRYIDIVEKYSYFLNKMLAIYKEYTTNPQVNLINEAVALYRNFIQMYPLSNFNLPDEIKNIFSYFNTEINKYNNLQQSEQSSQNVQNNSVEKNVEKNNVQENNGISLVECAEKFGIKKRKLDTLEAIYIRNRIQLKGRNARNALLELYEYLKDEGLISFFEEISIDELNNNDKEKVSVYLDIINTIKEQDFYQSNHR